MHETEKLKPAPVAADGAASAPAEFTWPAKETAQISEAAAGQLSASQMRYRRLFETARDGILLLNADTAQIEDVNPYLIEMLGYSHAEFMDKKLWEVGAFADIAESKEMFAVLQDKGYIRYDNLPLKTSSGKRIAVEFVSSSYDCAGIKVIQCNIRDMTAHYEADIVLREFKAIVDGSEDAIISKSLDGIIKSWNAGAEKLFGYSAQEAIGNHISIVIPPDHMNDEAMIIAHISRGERVQQFETVRRRKDGQLIDVSVTISPILDGSGKVIGVSKIARSIIERKQAEAESKVADAAKTRLAAIVENSNDAIYTRKLDGTILSWNAGAERMLGYTALEMVSASTAVAKPPNRPSNLSVVNDALLCGEVVVHESDRMTKDGRIINVLVSHSPSRDDGGAIVGASVIMQDITERNLGIEKLRQSEAFINSVLNSLSAQVAVLDHNGFIISVNDAWLTFARSNDAPENTANPIGVNYLEVCQRASDFQYGEEAPEVESGIRAVLRGEQSSFILEYPCHSPHEKRWFQLRVAPLLGSRAGAVISHENITSRKMVEVERASLEAQLRESQKMEAVGTLAGGIAHDFNNIVATILGNAELAFEDANTNPQATQESVREIQKAGRRARALIAQILSFSRRQPTARKAIGLTPVIEESVRLLRATIPLRISIGSHCDADAPAALADATQMQQIIVNLATNAMHAIPGNGRIDVRLDTVMLDSECANTHPQLNALHDRHPGRTIRIAISDTGSGMDAATVGRLFEPFFTTKPVGEGTGLGLSVVYGIVQTHEGTITVDSAPGKGTTFTIYLPIAKGVSTMPAIQASAAATAPKQSAGQHVLYLDDDEAQVLIVKRLLARRGYRVSDFTDQNMALTALRANPTAFDLVLTDYNMPGMSGLDVAREVRNIRADLPVVVTSGYIDKELQTQAVGAGVREVIFKADAVDVLCDAVKRVIDGIEPKPS